MAEKITLQAQTRTLAGRKVKTLRKQGILPINIFGKKIKSTSAQVDYQEFDKVFAQAGETQIVELQLGKEVRPVLVSNIQRNPVTGDYIHVDFHQIDLKEKVTATVPVEIIGEAPAEKEAIGIMVQQLNEVEVEALPADLPEKLVADVSKLAEVDAAIFVKDLQVDASKVTVLTDAESIVVKIEEPQKEEEPLPAPEAVEGAEGEVPVEGAPATDEAPKEEAGAEKPQA